MNLRTRTKPRLTELMVKEKKPRKSPQEIAKLSSDVSSLAHINRQLQSLTKETNRVLIHDNLLHSNVPTLPEDYRSRLTTIMEVQDLERVKGFSSRLLNTKKSVPHPHMHRWFQTVMLNLEGVPLPPELLPYDTTTPPKDDKFFQLEPPKRARKKSQIAKKIADFETTRLEAINANIIDRMQRGEVLDPAEVREQVYSTDPASLANDKLTQKAERYKIRAELMEPILDEFIDRLSKRDPKRGTQVAPMFGGNISNVRLSLKELVELAEIQQARIQNPESVPDRQQRIESRLREKAEAEASTPVFRPIDDSVQQLTEDAIDFLDLNAQVMPITELEQDIAAAESSANLPIRSRLALPKGRLEDIQKEAPGWDTTAWENLDEYDNDFIDDESYVGDQDPAEADAAIKAAEEARERAVAKTLQQVSGEGGKSFDELEKEAQLQDEETERRETGSAYRAIRRALDMEAVEGEEDDENGDPIPSDNIDEMEFDTYHSPLMDDDELQEFNARFDNDNIGFFVDVPDAESVLDTVENNIVAETGQLPPTATQSEYKHCSDCRRIISLIPLFRYAYHLKSDIYPFKPTHLLPNDPAQAFKDGVCNGCYYMKKAYSFKRDGKTIRVPAHAIAKPVKGQRKEKIPKNYETFYNTYQIYGDLLKK